MKKQPQPQPQQAKPKQEQKGRQPDLSGSVQKVTMVKPPSSEGAKDGEYQREKVGRLALWKVETPSELGAFLFGSLEINNRQGKCRLYHFNGNSLNSPVFKGEILDIAYNVVGEIALWKLGKGKEKSPTYQGRITFPRTETEYSVSLWGDVKVDDEDAPF